MHAPRRAILGLLAVLSALLAVGGFTNVASASPAVAAVRATSVTWSTQAARQEAVGNNSTVSLCGYDAEPVPSGSTRIYIVYVPDLQKGANYCFGNLTDNSSFNVVSQSPGHIVVYGTGPLGTGYYGKRDQSSNGTPAVDVNTDTFGNATIHFHLLL